MNKKLKRMAIVGATVLMTASSVGFSNAMSVKNINPIQSTGKVYICVNGKKLKYDESENGFICINLTVHGETSVEVTYKGTQLEKITFIISVVSSIMFIVYVVYCNKNKQLSLT